MRNFILLIGLMLITTTAFGQINITSSFSMQSGLPLDDRAVVADNTARDAIDPLRRFPGMVVYVIAEEKNYQLIGGVTNGDWVEFSGSGGGSGSLDKWATSTDYTTDQVVWLEDDNKIYRALSDFTSSSSFNPANWQELSEQADLSNLVTGPASAVDSNFMFFDGTTGKLAKDSGISLSTDGAFAASSDSLVPSSLAVKTYVDAGNLDQVDGPVSSTDSAIVLYDGTTGKIVKDSAVTISTDGTLATDSDSLIPTEKAVKTYVDAEIAGVPQGDVTGPVSSVARQVPVYSDTSGKDLETSKLLLPNMLTSVRLAGNTEDGADDHSMTLTPASGLGPTRGAWFGLYGNEHANKPSDIAFQLGENAGADFDISNGTESIFNLATNGNLTLGESDGTSNHLFHGTLAVSDQFGASLTLNGNSILAESGGGDASMTLQHQPGGSINRFDGTTYSKLGANPDYQELMKHPSFELDHEGVCSNCDATLAPSITPTPEDKNRLELVFSGAGTYTVDIDTGAGFSGLPATASCYVNTTNTDVQMAQRTNGVNGAIENVVSGGSEVLVIPSKQGLAGTTSTGFQIIAGSAGTVYLNNCSVNTENKIYHVSNSTGWEPYTPVVEGLGTISGDSFYWRRVADSVEIRGTFTVGTPSASEARVYLPNGLSSSSSIATLEWAGGATSSAFSGALFSTEVLMEPSVQYVSFGRQDTTAGGYLKRDGDAIFISGNVVSFNASVPVEGWGATTDAMSAQAMGARLDVSNEGTASSVTVGNAEITAPFDTVKEAKNILWSTANNEATIQVAGLYEISPELIILNGAAAANSQIFPEVDTGSGYAELTTVSKCRINTSNASTDRMRGACRFLVKLNAGDKVRVQVASNNASTLLLNTSPHYGRLVINRVWDEEQINALLTETVKYDGSEMLDRERIDNGDGTFTQVYKRCWKVESNITSATTIATIDTGLSVLDAQKTASTVWLLADYSYATGTGDKANLSYNSSSGAISYDVNGRTVYAGTRPCIRYTK